MSLSNLKIQQLRNVHPPWSSLPPAVGHGKGGEDILLPPPFDVISLRCILLRGRLYSLVLKRRLSVF